MGIRAAWKKDLQTISAEMIYGEAMRLLGQFLDETNNETNSSDDFKRLRRIMKKLQPKLTRRHEEKTTFIYKDLATTQQVFNLSETMLQQDAPYKRHINDEPYEVLSRSEKTQDTNQWTIVNVSLDRLKSAYMLEQEDPEQSRISQILEQSTEQRTRNGRISPVSQSQF